MLIIVSVFQKVNFLENEYKRNKLILFIKIVKLIVKTL